jgi:hypothetical protein
MTPATQGFERARWFWMRWLGTILRWQAQAPSRVAAFELEQANAFLAVCKSHVALAVVIARSSSEASILECRASLSKGARFASSVAKSVSTHTRLSAPDRMFNVKSGLCRVACCLSLATGLPQELPNSASPLQYKSELPLVMSKQTCPPSNFLARPQLSPNCLGRSTTQP